MQMNVTPSLALDSEAITAFCRKWKITVLELFGSVLRDDFRPDSDIDVLVTFEPGEAWSLFDLAHMQEELREIFGRNVDVVERIAVEQSRNPFRKRSILANTRVIYNIG